MGYRTIEVEASSEGAPEAVYAALMDRAAVVAWSPMDTCELDSPADGPDPEGVGAVRRQVMGRTTGFDTLVELIPGERFAYTHRGLPVVDYRGVVDITPTTTGSHIRWKSSFKPQYPGTGWLLQRGVKKFLQESVSGLAEYAGRS